MREQLPESDWKRTRGLASEALERFCARFADEIATISSDTDRSAQERYDAIQKLAARREKQRARTFDDLRRSTALLKLALMKGQGLLRDTEWAGFTPQTRQAVDKIAEG